MADPATASKRTTRSERSLTAFNHALRFDRPKQALSHMRGNQATWDAVRKIASELLNDNVRNVWLAWRIVDYVNALPDGAERLQVATDAAVKRWAEQNARSRA